MTITKIALLIGASVVTAGSAAAVATRDKWLPKSEEKNQNKGDEEQEEDALKKATGGPEEVTEGRTTRDSRP